MSRSFVITMRQGKNIWLMKRLFAMKKDLSITVSVTGEIRNTHCCARMLRLHFCMQTARQWHTLQAFSEKRRSRQNLQNWQKKSKQIIMKNYWCSTRRMDTGIIRHGITKMRFA